jgi:uncharacterized protein with NRDE domain
MCLLYIANNVHKEYKFILAANRDEFYDRPSLSAHFWENHPDLLAGKDLKAGGTWLGITKSGRLAAITNYRDMKNIKPNAPSRGSLTTDFLVGSSSPEEYYSSVEKEAQLYNGFNLIFGNAADNDLYYFSNQSNEFKKLDAGTYGLSNCLLDTPWPKVEKVKARFSDLINEEAFNEEKAFDILYDMETAEDSLLPDTGVGPELEKLLSSVFIKFQGYGTRCSTLILIDRQNKATFTEKTYFHEKDEFKEKNFQFFIGEQE